MIGVDALRSGAAADPLDGGGGQAVDELEGGVEQGVGGHDVDREAGEVSDDAEAVGSVGVAQMRLPDLVEEVDGGEEDEVVGDQAEQRQGRAQDQAGQEQPALAGGLGGEGVAVAAGDVGGGEDGDGGEDVDDPGEDGSGDQEDAEDGGDEAVGDLPAVPEQVEALADEGDAAEAAGGRQGSAAEEDGLPAAPLREGDGEGLHGGGGRLRGSVETAGEKRRVGQVPCRGLERRGAAGDGEGGGRTASPASRRRRRPPFRERRAPVPATGPRVGGITPSCLKRPLTRAGKRWKAKEAMDREAETVPKDPAPSRLTGFRFAPTGTRKHAGRPAGRSVAWTALA